MRELRNEAAEAAKARLKSWWELAPGAQDTLERAANGELPSDWSDEQIRSAVKASVHIMDRCLGTVKQMHEHHVAQQAIVVHVAGASGDVVEIESQQDRG